MTFFLITYEVRVTDPPFLVVRKANRKNFPGTGHFLINPPFLQRSSAYIEPCLQNREKENRFSKERGRNQNKKKQVSKPKYRLVFLTVTRLL